MMLFKIFNKTGLLSVYSFESFFNKLVNQKSIFLNVVNTVVHFGSPDKGKGKEIWERGGVGMMIKFYV